MLFFERLFDNEGPRNLAVGHSPTDSTEVVTVNLADVRKPVTVRITRINHWTRDDRVGDTEVSEESLCIIACKVDTVLTANVSNWNSGFVELIDYLRANLCFVANHKNVRAGEVVFVGIETEETHEFETVSFTIDAPGFWIANVRSVRCEDLLTKLKSELKPAVQGLFGDDVFVTGVFDEHVVETAGGFLNVVLD